MNEPAKVRLDGVPETMLWTLHNRASEAMRDDGIIRDPDALRIYQAIEYDYAASFGRANSSHATRSRIFDEAVAPWMAEHPEGVVVELACGLETQFKRVDDGRVRWLCVDLPEAIATRERFLPPTDRCTHLGCSALDPAWLDHAAGLAAGAPVFVSAQGLLMYFEPADVEQMIRWIFERFTQVDLMFDTIPTWMSKTVNSEKGMWLTPTYRAPRMPWGINRSDIAPTLHRWSDRIGAVESVHYKYYRGVPGMMMGAFSKLPWLRDMPPCITRATSAR